METNPVPQHHEHKTVVILQSNYIPWKGYFDLMNAADVFVVFDEVQYTRRDWRNRNRIVVGDQVRWLTIPVETKGRYDASICEIRIADPHWADKHWNSIRSAYSKAPFFRHYEESLAEAYRAVGALTHLSAINLALLHHLSPLLGIETRFGDSASVPRTTHDPAARLVEICRGHGATRYLSGPSAKSYIDPALFRAADIALEYADYSDYPVYRQQAAEFDHGVSAIDLLMNTGPDAGSHLKSNRSGGLFDPRVTG